MDVKEKNGQRKTPTRHSIVCRNCHRKIGELAVGTYGCVDLLCPYCGRWSYTQDIPWAPRIPEK